MSSFESGSGLNGNTGNIDSHALLVDNPGRVHIQKILRTHNNPAEALIELQHTLGLGFAGGNISLPFLDLLEVPRASVYQTLFESAKIKLEELLQNLSEDKLLNILSATFRYITVKDLKSTPLNIIKRLRSIPEKYLKALASKKLQGILEEIPISVRRQVWRVDSSHFIQSVMEYSMQWIKSAKEEGNLRPNHSVECICDLIGDSKYLFSKFAQFCTQHVFFEDKEILWATLLRHTVMGIMKEKIPALSKLRDFSLQIDQAIRESSVGAVVARNLVNYLKDIRRAAEVTQNVLTSNPSSSSSNVIKKTLPPSAPPSRPKRPIVSELTLQLKDYVTTLREKKEFKLFLTSAVDQILETESKERYLQMIQNPMDLTKILKQIHKYQSIEEFESDIRLMLDNCKTFNGPGLLSDIADECWKIWLQSSDTQGKFKKLKSLPHVEEIPTVSAISVPVSDPVPVAVTDVVKLESSTPSTSTPSTKSTPSKTSRSVTFKAPTKPTVEEGHLTLIEKLTNAWNFVNSLDPNGLFASPVVEQYPGIAQEYRKIVTKPMDLRTIKEKFSSYRTFKEFDEDICLMYRNAENFNKQDTFLLPIVRGMSNKWKKERSTFSQGKIQSVPVESESLIELSPILESERSEVNSMITDLRKSINDALDYFSKIDKGSVFAAPVMIPGYTDIIKDPRDLHSIRANSSKYRTIDQFEADIQLMLQNCIKYNHFTGDKNYVNLAVKLWKLWKDNRKAVFLGQPLPISSIIHELDGVNDKDLMELADNSESDDEDWGMEETSSIKKKRPKTEVPSSSSSSSSLSKQHQHQHQHQQSNGLKNNVTPKGKNSSQSKQKEKSTFIKPLPLHVQSLSSIKSGNGSSTTTTPTTTTTTTTAPAPSIESLIAAMPSSSRKNQQMTASSTAVTPSDNFSIEIVSWAVVILQDTQLQELFHQHFISLLFSMCERSALPFNDDNLQNIFLLCQFSLSRDSTFHDINQPLLRKILPLIMLLSLDPSQAHVEFNQSFLQQHLSPHPPSSSSSSAAHENFFDETRIFNFMSKTFESLKGKVNHHSNNLSNKTDSSGSGTSGLLGSISIMT